jgi:CcmD family protein
MRNNLVLALALAAGLGVTAASAAHAQEDAAEQRATSFQAVQGAVTEDVPGAPLLVAAYALIWLGVLGYVWRVARLQADGMTQLAELSRQIQAQSGGRKPAE